MALNPGDCVLCSISLTAEFSRYARGALLSIVLAAAPWAAVSPSIHVNQIGFHPQTGKKCIVVDSTATEFFIATANLADTVFTGKLGPAQLYSPSNEMVRLGDFSAFRTPGTYVVGVPGLGVSAPFTIDGHADLEVVKGAIRGFYYQRASCTLKAANAGKWARPPGHPDNRVYVHSSAASTTRPAETVISATKGWYDAGDYNKYVVNSGISTYTLLALYRHYSVFFDTLKLNIPESGNAIPDLLDECLWNLRWMMAMQDPNDGGVYHKLTTAEFSGFVMPDADDAERYVVQKSVTASLDLAATAAYAARVFRKFDGPLPGFADSALNVARKAWKWARENPTALYNQAKMNLTYTPAINTGEYGDSNPGDELFWAGMELYLTTREDSFFVAAAPSGNLPSGVGVPSWGNVTSLGLYSLLEESNNGFSKIDTAALKQKFITAANSLRDRVAASPYGLVMGNTEFTWGSNSVDANEGMLLLQAFQATRDSSYLMASVDALDYLLGRNATGYSFVTGFGSKTPMFPHHRPSSADGISDPVPGLLVGGPNPGQNDKCVYQSALPALSYLDSECSFSSNEIAINWNAPFAYLAGGLESTFGAGIWGGLILPNNGVRKPLGRIGGGQQVRIEWLGNRFRSQWPNGWKGSVEFFDTRGGRRDGIAKDMDGGLLVYRLKGSDAQGHSVIRSGSISRFAPLKVDL